MSEDWEFLKYPSKFVKGSNSHTDEQMNYVKIVYHTFHLNFGFFFLTWCNTWSSHVEEFYEKIVFKNSQKTISSRVSFLIKLQAEALLKKTLGLVFSSEFCELRFFYSTPPQAASRKMKKNCKRFLIQTGIYMHNMTCCK